MNTKVLYISYDGMTDPLGQSQVLPYLAELSKQGFRFTLMSFEKKKRYESERAIIEKICRENNITWVPLFFTARPPILSKIYDRWNLVRTAKKLHKKEKFDLVHCRSYIAAEAGLKLKKQYGVKFLFDMRGFWADERVDNGQWDLKKPLYKRLYDIYKKKEKQFLLNADGIVSLTKAGKDYLLSRPDYRSVSIDVIPCCADLASFDYNRIRKETATALRASLSIPPGKRIITYLGSVGGWYMTNEMFAFYRQLIKQYPDFILLLLTKDDRQKVESEAVAAGIEPSQIVVRYAKRDEVPVYLSISDCSIFFIRPTFSKKASSPTKHGELMGMGIPVICNDIGDTGNIIEKTRTGAVIKTFSEEGYREVIDKLPEILSLDRAMIRQQAFEYFDLKKGAQTYYELYHKILNISK